MGAVGRTLNNYAKLMRVSNLPTCLANVLTGIVIGMQFGPLPTPVKLTGLALTICCYYCGGMILNDLCDIKYDKVHKANRPIVAGQVRFLNAAILTGILFIIPSVILAFMAPHSLIPAGVLLACIILYDMLHKITSFSIIFMGACRGLVYVTAAVAVAEPSESVAAAKMCLPFAIILAFYTVGITVIARLEDKGKLDLRKWLSLAMPLGVFAILLFVRPTEIFYAIFTGVLFGVWMICACLKIFAKPAKIKNAVLIWLSGMCLMDMLFLTVLDQRLYALIALACFSITVRGHKRISGT